MHSIESGGSGGREDAPLYDKDVLTLARTIHGEARGEPPAGRQAVGHVIPNRARMNRARWGGAGVADVCQQRMQFSCRNENDPDRAEISSIRPGDNPVFDQCYETAEKIINGELPDNTGGATHYYATSIPEPSSARPPAELTVQIGHHKFYKNVA